MVITEPETGRKSGRSYGAGECVRVSGYWRTGNGYFGVFVSEWSAPHRRFPVLAATWNAFTAAIKNGEYDNL